MKEEWLFPNAFVPVDVETTSALVVEIKRLIDVVGGMALAQPAQEPVATLLLQSKETFERNFGSNGYADWIYEDLAELMHTPQPVHVISEQEQLKQWIETTKYFTAKREYEPWCMKMNGCKTKCADCPDEPAQEPVGVFCEDDDIGYVRLIPHQQMKLKAWDKLYTAPPAAQPAQQEPDYAYPTIEGYEEITGFKVNDTFRMGWAMARTTNDLFRQMEKQP